MRSRFGHENRLLMCTRCGAPLEIALEGGEYGCPECNETNRFSAREEVLAREEMQRPAVGEVERLDRLRRQDGRPLLPPENLKKLIEGGRIPPWKLQEALVIWQSVRKRAAYHRAHGKMATATVVNLALTGTRVNNVPQYKVTLKIQLDDQAPYEAKTKLLLNAHSAAQLNAGLQLPARVDPQDPQSVLLELD